MATIVVLSTQVALEVKECPVCGVTYGIPEMLANRRHRDGGNWFCPNGHSLSYTETEVDKLRKQLNIANSDASFFRQQRDGALDQLSDKTKKLRNIKRRIYAGVCPECKRHFVNLERHMKTKHSRRKVE